ncbi:hypothetical protein L9F63_001186, partial [Diploptera punctata]
FFFLLGKGVFFYIMQCGFACLEAGAVRSKNATNIIMKNIMDIFISSVAYWLVGYALAYGDGNAIIGYTHWAGIGIDYGKMAHWFFQCIFAATAATIVSGAVAERCNYIAYIVYSAVISGLVYPPITHWTWTDEGWLKQLGYVDYSGCGPVHLLGGVCSLFGALFIGPRIGKFGNKYKKLEKEDIVGHSVPLSGIGGMILIAGFLAFNGGSIGSMSNPGDEFVIARVIINTILGGSGGSIVMLALCKLGFCGYPAWSFSLTLNAALAGMVSVCAGGDDMAMWAGFVSGAIVAPIYLAIHYFMLRMKIDDPLDAVAVHLGGGFWGLISASLFGYEGIVYGASYESAAKLWFRLVGAAIIIMWGSIASCIMFGLLRYFGKLRVTEEQELEGLDISMHNEPGYPVQGWVIPPHLPSCPPSESKQFLKSSKSFIKHDIEALIRPDKEIAVKPVNGTIKPETEALLKTENETSSKC